MPNPVDALHEKLVGFLTRASLPCTVLENHRIRVQRGSTAVFLKASTWAAGHTIVELVCPVLKGVERTHALLEKLNELNTTLYFGKAYWHEGGVWLAHNLLGDHVDPEELVTALGMMATVADRTDDGLKSDFGGQRWIET